MNKEFNLIDVIRTLLKWKWHIISVTILAAIGAVIVSLFVMKPYYQSYALLYPTNQSMGDRLSLFGDKSAEKDAYYYGTKHDANRIITIATASKVTAGIIEEYNLAEHYDFKGKKYEATYTNEKFEKLYKVYKTDKDAIRINLLDTDPQLAATIVNDVVATIEYETSKPIQQNKQELADLFEVKATDKKEYTEQLKEKLLSTSKKSDQYDLLQKEYSNALNEYTEMAKLAEQYAVAAEKEMPGVQVIEYAYPAEMKLKPVRSRIVVITTFLAFVLASLGALGFEQWQIIKEQL
jgi:uncharacterized protein involved in exopolysaccharide biosynthesis